jgi:hypothetical protein
MDELDAILRKHGIDPQSVAGGAFCGKGWQPIVDRLLGNLVEMGWDRRLDQVKEKFGELRFYIRHGSREMFEVIEMAERASRRTCEFCGADGRPRDDLGWVKTACDACLAKAVKAGTWRDL